MGWAAEIPEFKAIGYELKGLPRLGGGYGRNLEPYFNGYYGFSAICDLFDLNAKQAEWIFTHDAYQEPGEEEIYATVADICERIQRLVEGEDVSKYRIHNQHRRCGDD